MTLDQLITQLVHLRNKLGHGNVFIGAATSSEMLRNDGAIDRDCLEFYNLCPDNAVDIGPHLFNGPYKDTYAYAIWFRSLYSEWNPTVEAFVDIPQVWGVMGDPAPSTVKDIWIPREPRD